MNELITEVEAGEVLDRLELAVVKRVKSLEPIPGKDRVELVHLEDCGYTTVCEKYHTVGDLVVFTKYDTVVPKLPIFEFMESFKYRVKPKSFTIKDGEDVVGKIYSQGIVLPLQAVLNQLGTHGGMLRLEDGSEVDIYSIQEGLDLTKTLGVTKYIPPVITGAGSSVFGEMRRKGDFPSHLISKTDELNLANKTRLIDELQGKTVYITLKIEGSSSTDYYEPANGELIVCSRNNMIADAETNKFWIAARKYNLAEKLKEYPTLILQGELYGQGIQKNKLGIEGVDLAVFNIEDREHRRRLGLTEMLGLATILNLNLVPIICIIEDFNWTFDDLQKYADCQKYANGEAAEGIVIRPVDPFFSPILRDWFSVKCINRDYKL